MTTGLITPTTEGQEKQFSRIVEDAIAQARNEVVLDKDAMQRLMANGGRFQNDIVASLIRHSIADTRFGLISSFTFTVPKSYDHGSQLNTFAKLTEKVSENFYNCSSYISDENYVRVTNRLVPEKIYGGKIFSIKECVSSEDCLAFLTTQQAILVGAQGLSLVRQLKKNKFPVNKFTISLDKKDALWEDPSGDRGVPCMYQHLGGEGGLYLGYFGHDWHSDYCLLCINELRT